MTTAPLAIESHAVTRFVVAVWVVLPLARVLALLGRDLEPTWSLPVAVLWQDAVVGLAFAVVACALRRRPRIVAAVFWALVGFTALNVVLMRAIATPLTWPMLRATGSALSDSIFHYLTFTNLAVFTSLLVVAAVVTRLWRSPGRRAFVPACALAVLVGATGMVFGRSVDTHGLHRHGLYVLATTAWPRPAGAGPVATTDPQWRRVRASDTGPDLSGLRGAARGRHVVQIVLESVAARYLRPYGAVDDPMPNLTSLAGRGLLFENAYAVYPESIKGLVALWHSVHPAMHTEPADYRELDAPSIGDVLALEGYRTAVFHSGRFEYLGMEHVLAGSGFDTRVDAGAISGAYDSSFGVDDCDTVDALLGWIDERESGEQWFVEFLPVSGHHPYDAPERGPYPNTELFGAYRNAIGYADRAIGRLIDGLRARGVWDETLLVIVGDHGQAFGQHEANYGHTFFLYDENVHVPLLVVAPGLTDGGERPLAVASHVDLAPTMLDLLGIAVPGTYEGRTLLDRTAAAALMFTDYSLPLLAMREGPWKCIVDLESDRVRLFDLRSDPGETDDRSLRQPDLADDFAQRLRGWASAQSRRFDQPP